MSDQIGNDFLSIMLGLLLFVKQAVKSGEELAACLDMVAPSQISTSHRAGVEGEVEWWSNLRLEARKSNRDRNDKKGS